jgi:hypothetical protein
VAGLLAGLDRRGVRRQPDLVLRGPEPGVAVDSP